MKQHYIVLDVALCHDCNNCFVACKDEHADNSWLPYTQPMPWHGHRWMNIQRLERGEGDRVDVAFLPTPCQHCADAPCVKAHPDCISRRSDGIVLLDPQKAQGKKDIMDSCPYGVFYWNEESAVAQKCTMCAHLLDDGWAMPRCVHSCPTGALQFYTVEPEEMEKKVAKEKLSSYRAEIGTKPNVYYKNLYRFTKNFITGAVLKDDDCLEDAVVQLTGNAVDSAQKTDYFGEFKFDGLDDGAYTLSVNGKAVKTVEISSKSVNVGEIPV
ncbi:MAG: oxidoreductase [Clostridiales Family XIII bacterium]|jgi:Fe-S-cluster-containing dehydrogenase component|nr:oxidoreductase [Clostridiales Family XIII bacterium]